VKRGLLATLIVISSIALFLLTYDYRSEQEQFFSDYDLTKEEIAMIEDGDIILRHGYGLVSDGIVETMQEKWELSHCAILWKDSASGEIKVIHSVSQSLSECDGVQVQSLKRFIHDSQENSIMLVRFKAPDGMTQKNISTRGQYYLGRQIPFDHSFDIDDTARFYCSELLWQVVLDEYDVDIFKGKNNEQKDHLKFDNFYASENFDVIFNHNER
jgi:Permuted papain-like amidase enzyme, YaeF/YiiX, C92 family